MSENSPHWSHDWQGVDEETSLNQFCHYCDICTCHGSEMSSKPCAQLIEAERKAAQTAWILCEEAILNKMVGTTEITASLANAWPRNPYRREETE